MTLSTNGRTSHLSLASTLPNESASKLATTPWRMLWKGGLQVGDEGYFLEGLAFFGKISFGSRLKSSQDNPFDAVAPVSAAFVDLHSDETDLCLSLETQRGRKALHYRGVVTLDDSEDFDTSSDSDSSVQMSISQTAAHTQHFIKALICRSSSLTTTGRTRCALLIGLGDEDLSPNSSIIVYGQCDLSLANQHDALCRLKLLVARKPMKRATNVQPGDPLPRAEPKLVDPAREFRNPSGAIDIHRKLGKRQALERHQSAKSHSAVALTDASRRVDALALDRTAVDPNELRMEVIQAIRRRSQDLSNEQFDEVMKTTMRGTLLALRRNIDAANVGFEASRLISLHLDMYIGKVPITLPRK